jgi:hypothetical protein
MDDIPRIDPRDGQLLCPYCGNSYLHHIEVRVYDRGEDDDLTDVTRVKDGLAATHREPSLGCDNPSSRRDGVEILFWCEDCYDPDKGNDSRVFLTIAQHKGNTVMGWRKKSRWKV